MADLQHHVSSEVGAVLVMFKLDRGDSFRKQVGVFEDACVIIGMHGAGLALSVFAPPKTALIEIEPDYHFLSLFGNSRSGGLRYDVVQLSKGTTSEPMFSSNLIQEDEQKIRELLKNHLLEQKELLKVAHSSNVQ